MEFCRFFRLYSWVPGLEDVSVRRTFEALEVLRNRALQIDIYLLTYLVTYLPRENLMGYIDQYCLCIDRVWSDGPLSKLLPAEGVQK